MLRGLLQIGIAVLLAIFIFLNKYKGDLPWRLAWLILLVLLIISFGLGLVRQKMKQIHGSVQDSNAIDVAALRLSGERIIITAENCEIKMRPWYQEDDERAATKTSGMDGWIDPAIPKNENGNELYCI